MVFRVYFIISCHLEYQKWLINSFEVTIISNSLHSPPQLKFTVGLSKERPILDHHAKAHILKSGGFHADFMKSGRFHMKSTRFRVDFMWNPPTKVINPRKTSVLWSAVGRLCHVFTWNPPDFERPIARNDNPYVFESWSIFPGISLIN